MRSNIPEWGGSEVLLCWRGSGAASPASEQVRGLAHHETNPSPSSALFLCGGFPLVK
jgi:hypothetical protein